MSQVLTPLTEDAVLQAGESIAVQFSATLLTVIVKPTDQALLSALGSDSRYSPKSFTSSISSQLNLIGYGGTVLFTITDDGDQMTVAEMEVSLRNQLNSFYSLAGASINEVDSVSNSLTPSISTTVVIAAIAIILVVLLVFYFQVKRTVTI